MNPPSGPDSVPVNPPSKPDLKSVNPVETEYVVDVRTPDFKSRSPLNTPRTVHTPCLKDDIHQIHTAIVGISTRLANLEDNIYKKLSALENLLATNLSQQQSISTSTSSGSIFDFFNEFPAQAFDETIENEPGTSPVVHTNIVSPGMPANIASSIMPASITSVTTCNVADKYSPVFPNVDMCSAPIASTVFQPVTPDIPNTTLPVNMCSSAPIASPTVFQPDAPNATMPVKMCSPTVFQPDTPNATLPINTVEASSNNETCVTPKDLTEEHCKSNSQKNFAVRIFRRIFTKEEQKGANCTGTRGKAKLDPDKLAKVRQYTYQYFPLEPGVNEEKDW